MIIDILKTIATILSIIIIVLLVIFFSIRFFNGSANICTSDDQCMVYELSCCPDNINTTAFNKGYKTTLDIEKKISCWVLNPECFPVDDSSLPLTNKAHCTQQSICSIKPDCETVCDALEERKDDARYEKFVNSSLEFGCKC